MMFKIAGTTKFEGEYKVRFGTDFTSRVKMLIKQGHEEVELLELPSEMTKGEAVRHLLTLSDRFSPGALEAIEAADEKYSGGDVIQSKRAVGVGRGARPEKFSHVGTTTHRGVTKVRFASDGARVRLLEKQGHTEITLVQLPEPMLKADAVMYILTDLSKFTPAAQVAITQAHARYRGENTVTVSKKKGRVRATAVTASEVLAAVEADPA
jgi:hypothetical protein